MVWVALLFIINLNTVDDPRHIYSESRIIEVNTRSEAYCKDVLQRAINREDKISGGIDNGWYITGRCALIGKN